MPEYEVSFWINTTKHTKVKASNPEEAYKKAVKELQIDEENDIIDDMQIVEQAQVTEQERPTTDPTHDKTTKF